MTSARQAPAPVAPALFAAPPEPLAAPPASESGVAPEAFPTASAAMGATATGAPATGVTVKGAAVRAIAPVPPALFVAPPAAFVAEPASGDATGPDLAVAAGAFGPVRVGAPEMVAAGALFVAGAGGEC